MAWTARRRTTTEPEQEQETPAEPDARPTLRDLLGAVEERVCEMEGVASDITEERERIKARLVNLAHECGLPLDTCKLPGCGAPYIRVPENKEFCIPGHKVIFNNKYAR